MSPHKTRLSPSTFRIVGHSETIQKPENWVRVPLARVRIRGTRASSSDFWLNHSAQRHRKVFKKPFSSAGRKLLIL